jgi:hypothetical protein
MLQGVQLLRRGWVGPHKYLADRRQRQMLIDAGVEERAIYVGRNDWSAFVRSLRPGDEAVVADLRIFGSRKGLGEAAEQIAGRQATLITALRDVPIDPVTLREVQRVESLWAGERSMGGSKRARELSKRGIAALRKKIADNRMAKSDAEAIWYDLERYPLRSEAIEAMRGWTVMTAWRAFGAREKKRSK